MPRSIPTIHLDVSFSASDADEADMRQWVRATEILLRIKARRDARLAGQVLDETNAETDTPPLETTKDGNEL